ncbi:MAG: tetratricopeptide repeat protein [Bacteroidales bacterium]|nr:tetratricopeptide repeat protein [Bacteroidales bacterium]
MRFFKYSAAALLFAVMCCLPATAQTGNFIEALRLYNEGDVRGAYAGLRKTISEDPDNDAAYFYMSSLLRDSTLATSMLKKALEKDPDNFWYSYTLATRYQQAGKNAEAAAILEELLEKAPKRTSLYFDLIGLYMSSGQSQKALDVLDKIEELVGKSDLTVMTRADLLSSQNKPQEALACLEECFNETGSARVACALGEICAATYKDELALEYFDKALENEPTMSRARCGKAHIHRAKSQYDLYFENIMPFLGDAAVSPNAKVDYMESVVASPQFVQTFTPQVDSMVMAVFQSAPMDTVVINFTSGYMWSTGHIDQALALAKASTEIYPDSFSQTMNYVAMLYYSEDWNALLGASSAALGRFPDNLEILQIRALTYWHLDRKDNSMADYEKMLALAPKDSANVLMCCSALGDMCYEKYDEKTAFKYYERGLKINPRYAPILNNYAYYISERYPSPMAKPPKDLRKALEMSRITIEQEPDNCTYLDTYAWILHLMGQDLEAKAHFKHAMIYGGKESGAVLRHYAAVLEALGDKDRAEVYRQQANRYAQ